MKPTELATDVAPFQFLRGAHTGTEGAAQRVALACSIVLTGANLAQGKAILAAWLADPEHCYIPTPAELGAWAVDYLKALDENGLPIRRAPDPHCIDCGGCGWEYVVLAPKNGASTTAVQRCACTGKAR